MRINYLNSPRILYHAGISFYSTKIVFDQDFGSNKQILGMEIRLSERLTNDQIKILDAIDTFYMLSPQVILFKTFARMEREKNCNT